MIVTKSPLLLKSFTVLNSSCHTIPFSEMEGGASFKETQDKYAIDLDFGIKKEKLSGQTLIFVKLSINPEKNPGYSIFAEGVGIFSFDETEELSEKDKRGLIQYSAVSICITNVRSFVANMTAYSPFGIYNFPSIDMNALLKQKSEQK